MCKVSLLVSPISPDAVLILGSHWGFLAIYPPSAPSHKGAIRHNSPLAYLASFSQPLFVTVVADLDAASRYTACVRLCQHRGATRANPSVSCPIRQKAQTGGAILRRDEKDWKRGRESETRSTARNSERRRETARSKRSKMLFSVPRSPMALPNTNGTVPTAGDHHIWLVTGPAGTGKTTLATFLATQLDVPYIEGDEVSGLTPVWPASSVADTPPPPPSFTPRPTSRRCATASLSPTRTAGTG